MILKLFRRLPNPLPGQTWYYTRPGVNPWDREMISKVYVIDVKDGWVAFSRYHADACYRKSQPSQWEDNFMKISEFKSTYNRGIWNEKVSS